MDEDEILKLAAGVEKFSEHPLAQAVVESAQEKGLNLKEARERRTAARRQP